jgi:hypothetical protein
VAVDRVVIRQAWDGERLGQLALRPVLRARRTFPRPISAGPTPHPHHARQHKEPGS